MSAQPPHSRSQSQSPIEIRSGLRRLEFETRPGGGSAEGSEHALVEFVRSAPLEQRVSVRVELGLRDGALREIIGQPSLVETVRSKNGELEYRYRLRAAIAQAPIDAVD